MKFAKELEQELVPEWKISYLDYKAGKKRVKAVSRAIHKANGTPKNGALPPREAQPFLSGPSTARGQNGGQNMAAVSEEEGNSLRAGNASGLFRRGKAPTTVTPRTEPTPIPPRTENQPLTSSPGNEGRYGSFVPTPPTHSPLGQIGNSQSTFELPAPAMKVPSNHDELRETHPSSAKPTNASRTSFTQMAMRRSMSASTALGVHGEMGSRNGHGNENGNRNGILAEASPMSNASPGRLRRIFSTGPSTAKRDNGNKFEYKMHSLDTVRQREQEFVEFLDKELAKVESFYKQKENQAEQRIKLLKEQLREMRSRRVQELDEMRRPKEQRSQENSDESNSEAKLHRVSQAWIDPHSLKSRIFKPGPNSKALQSMPRTPMFEPRVEGEGGRDYVRNAEYDVPYKSAKRKLKVAMQEFYKALELLKSYTILNRTAFRKLNKKYDKAVNARPPLRYMNQRVNKAYFVTSDKLDEYIKDAEDLYARYFEKGNHKIAAGKLRRIIRKPGDKSGSTFLNGLFIGIGTVFAVQGLIYGAQLLYDEDPIVRSHTSYLMQIYGGYFLMLLLFAYFCVDCYIWTVYKVNYPSIFEFDTRHNLDWRQLSQFPSFCWMLFGLFIWLNFTRYGSSSMYLYYPVILIFVTLLVLLFPAPVLAHRSRRWFAYAHYRLFFAGLYPVEFRDFFLGDMYCSLTYATCLFFCLYAHYWQNPDQCNSNHSVVLGLFAMLPPLWRAAQCVRRYKDTRNIFPHLVNCGKYGATILAAVMLTLYRLNNTKYNLALFATFSVINSLYTSVWDLLMDFSLMQPNTHHRLLRNILALKRKWVYYIIMTIDPILRFSWIFYAIFTYNKQHSTLASFLIGLAEVTRRGMWALLRVENEHCSNVAQSKASRDVPLPYSYLLVEHEPLVTRISTDTATSEPVPVRTRTADEATASAVDVGTSGTAPESPPIMVDEAGAGLRQRRRKSEVGGGGTIRKIMAEAHKQDFVKKKRPADGGGGKGDDEDHPGVAESDDDDEDDEDDDSASVEDARSKAREAEDLMQGDRGQS